MSPALSSALRPVRGSWTLVLARFTLIVAATAPAWAKGWSLIAAGPARQPYFTDVSGPLPLPHILQMFRIVGDKVPMVALGCAALAVLLSALLTAGALAVLAPDRPARGWRSMVSHAWSEGWEHLPAFLRILVLEVITLGLGMWLIGKAFDRLDITGQKGLWTAYTREVLLPLIKLLCSGAFMATVGAWGLHTRLLTVADERRRVRRTALLTLRLWRRRPWAGPGLFVVTTLAGVLLSGWVLVTWRQAPPGSQAAAWMRMVTWWGVLLLLSWLWHFLLRAGRILADRPDVTLIRTTPDEGFGLGRFVPFLALLVACNPTAPSKAPGPSAGAAIPTSAGAAGKAGAKPATDVAVKVPDKRGPPPKALEAWCSKCHKLPPPSVLTQNVWPDEVAAMTEIAGAKDMKLEGMTARDVAMWYGLSAPKRHPLYLGPKTAPTGPVQFIRRERCAAARKKLPGVSNVQLVKLTRQDKPQVLLTEMAAGQVLLFEPDKPQEGFKAIGVAKHPARASVTDLDNDGLADVLVSDLGVFYPSDEKKGAVIWLRGRKGGSFKPTTLASGLGRVADAQAADLDGDGDLDVAAAVFGWRTVGQVLALERNKGRVTRHTLLQRTGALHVIPSDLDGDGRTDLVVLFAQEHERVSALMNRGDWKFEEVVLHEAEHPAWGYSGMQLADLDGDGDQDVLLTNGDTLDLSGDKADGSAGPEHVLFPYHGVSWLESVGEMKFKGRRIAPLYGAHRAHAADIDGDGDMDVVASAYLPMAPEEAVRKPYRTEALIWLERRKPGQWLRHTLATMDVEIPTLDVGDIDGDGDADIVTGHLFLARMRPDHRDVSLTVWESQRAKNAP